MSLHMLIRQPSGAHLIVDGGLWNAEGVCTAIGRKVGLFPDLNMAIGWTGFGGHCEWIEEAVAKAGVSSQGDAIEALPAVLRDLVERHGSTAYGQGLALEVIAYSQERGSQAYLLSSRPENLPFPYQPFTVRPVRGYVDFANPDVVLGRPVAFDDPASFDVVRDGRIMAEVARVDPWRENGAVSYYVAGFADLYSAGPGGLQHRRLIEWPQDRVGERTDPFKKAA